VSGVVETARNRGFANPRFLAVSYMCWGVVETAKNPQFVKLGIFLRFQNNGIFETAPSHTQK